MHWGAWEGCKGADLLNARDSGYRNIEEWGWDYLPPDGETPRAVLARLRPWRDGLSGDTVAVCHIGVMRVLLAEATGWDFAGAPPFRIKRERLYVLTRECDGWSLAEAQPRLEALVP